MNSVNTCELNEICDWFYGTNKLIVPPHTANLKASRVGYESEGILVLWKLTEGQNSLLAKRGKGTRQG